MRFGVNTWVWTSPLTTAELAALAPKVKGMGFDWIELPFESLTDLDGAEAKAILAAHGLGASACAAMGPDRDLIHEESAIQENGMAYIRGCVDLCHAIGITNLVGPIYSAVGRTWQQTPEDRARDLDLLVANLKQLAAYAHDQGVVLCLEPLNRFETSFINLAEQAIEVIDRVDSPACQIMLDTFHMCIEEKSLGQAIRLAGSRLKHVHACENDRGAPGSGHVPWQDVAGALKAIHYSGPVVIESFTSKVKSIARAAAIWRSLAPSQDALAQEGVAFLKQLLA
ncbi:MAG: sugar phosphate isomerase/epimerase [Chloroflexi bacterium CFX4]|nr:sugar phosphate isomerase/epimerase [Chloroflexi bacterium CFX4]MDL1923595.1 sugar phosphate isomerase/epimerase [Chloroflexi bacterium CFX3]